MKKTPLAAGALLLVLLIGAPAAPVHAVVPTVLTYTALQDQTLCTTAKWGFTVEWLGATKGCPTDQTCVTADGIVDFVPVCIPNGAVGTPNYTDITSCVANCDTKQCYKQNDRTEIPLYYCGPAIAAKTSPSTPSTAAPTTPAVSTPSTAPSRQFVPIAPIPGLTQGATANEKGLATFLNNLYKFLVGIAAVIAVIEIIIGGLEISTKDSVPMNMKGKERIYQALIGLVLVLSPVLVFYIINPEILNLSVNLPALDTRPGPGSTTGTSGTVGVGTGRTVDAATGCGVTGASGVFQIATCPKAAADAWAQNCAKVGGYISVTPLTNSADGTGGTSRVFCMQANIFEFIDTHTSSLTSSIGRLQPLAVASNVNINKTDTLYTTNGVDAVTFANVCKSIGFKTCIDHRPTFSFSHACSPLPSTPLPAGAPTPAKCYTETLDCKDASFLSNDTCDSSPSWTPFQ